MSATSAAPRGAFTDFNELAGTVLAYRSSKPLLVALHYDLFSRIEEGFDTVAALARKEGLDPRALAILLNAIAALGFLSRKGRRYRNSPLASKTLVSRSPDYKGNNLKYQEQTWAAWSDLRHVLKAGKPRRSLLGWLHKETFTDDYIQAMQDIAKEPARELAEKLDWGGVKRTLDVGCGPGAYSAAFLRAAPEIEAVLFDLPGTLRVTKRFIDVPEHRGRFKLKSGNYLRDGLGHREFDLILISHVTHNESPETNRRLIRKAFRALKPGGRLVIHDFLLDDGRDGPKFSALFALHMLVFTEGGNVYTGDDYRGWMREAGFDRAESVALAGGSATPSHALVARRSRR